MPSHRRDFIRLSALAASAVALPAHADTSPKPMRLLILGGTGLIGPHQVRYALSRGHHVTIFNRGRQKESWPGPVEELLGDRNGDLKALEGRDWDACIDNPTTLPVWVRDAARVLKGHVGRSSSSRPSRPMPPTTRRRTRPRRSRITRAPMSWPRRSSRSTPSRSSMGR
jgi:2'-hydroxyisoflavone reductase